MYRIGVAQFAPQLMNCAENLATMQRLALQAQADLLVFPELATSGYVFSSVEDVRMVAEDAQNGPTASLFRALASRQNCSYVIGFAEDDNGVLYNSSMLVNPDGMVQVYRKMHLFYEEKKWFAPGNSGFNVFAAKDDVQVGMMICFDWMFPEAARTLALKGAQVIAHAANLVLPWCQKAMLTRSLENRVFSITANRTGTERNGARELYFTGMSQVVSTKGEILTRCDETDECVKVVAIDIAEALNKEVTTLNDAFGDRRPEWYGK